ncbi:MAG: GNAT family N-acetyltransferase [Limibacillus sp.]|jgi:putative acetyltransferase
MRPGLMRPGLVPPGLTITREDPRGAEIRPLIEALDAYQQALYPPESNHLLDPESLARPGALFFVARLETRPHGMAALVPAKAYGPAETYGELKRMFVTEEARGQGIAKALLLRIEQEARTLGLAAIKLETGSKQPEAIALYRRYGFEECGPFGEYQADPLSLFMKKAL